jgi:hypothetical protein
VSGTRLKGSIFVSVKGQSEWIVPGGEGYDAWSDEVFKTGQSEFIIGVTRGLYSDAKAWKKEETIKEVMSMLDMSRSKRSRRQRWRVI